MRKIIFVASVAATLLACGSSSGRSGTGAPTLSSIAVTPADPAVAVGWRQQFTATGTYTDATTQDLTQQVTWASSNPAVAVIDAGGLAACAGAGTSTISASMAGVTSSVTLTVMPTTPDPLAISTASLPARDSGVAYSATLAATGGTPPYTWSLASGALPPGLSLDVASGVISGTPTASGNFSFTVKVTDTVNATATRALSIAIDQPLSIATASLPGGFTGVAYSQTLSAAGGTSPYTWSLVTGAFPPGLSLAAGAITGTPTAAGNFSFTVKVTDAANATVSRDLSIAISPPYSLWANSVIPVLVDGGADNPVELGVRFRSDVDGFVTGVRFYKSDLNTGTHVGNLWSSVGAQLASATFTGETSSGWQQVTFGNPIAISANTDYVVSYHTDVGHYSADLTYFANSLDNPPLHAPGESDASINGVFSYGATSTFPSETFRQTNYWVDVMFAPTTATITSIQVTTAGNTLTSGQAVQLAATATYSDGTHRDVTTAAAWSSSDPNVALVSQSGLVTASVSGNATISATRNGVTGTVSLTVSPLPPPADQGPGGPILIVSSAANPFSRYYTEILQAEGFNEFTAKDISTVTSGTLSGYDIVLLGDFALTADQAAMLSGWVNDGGNLIAMRPDKKLAGLLGLVDQGTTLSDAYVRVNTAASPGAGIVGETMQFHGVADLYARNSANAVATLYSNASASTSAPAVTWRAAGLGQAAAFTYDLARSIVFTRQGNPAWSGEERDGIGPIRPDDLFFGAASFDPQPDWIDLAKVQIPQADEQQRLLGNLMLQMQKKPLPRFWYLPSGFKAAIVMTGDDHGTGGTAGRFDSYVAARPADCSVADWQCIRSTSYVFPNTPVTPVQALQYTTKGFEIALHVTTNCWNFTSYANLDAFYTQQLAALTSSFPGLPPSSTSRTHCIVWSDYDTQPKVESAHGIRLDTNYYYWPGSWLMDRPGFMTGSGMPMRFADRSGQMLDVYQAATQMTDESNQTYPDTVDALLDGAIGAEGYYGVFTANMHTDQVASAGSDAIIASATARGIPVVSASQMLQWLDGRNGSSFGQLGWAGNALSFNVSAAAGARNLQAMLPAQFSGRTLTGITRSGAAVPYQTETIKGVSYAIFSAISGPYQASY